MSLPASQDSAVAAGSPRGSRSSRGSRNSRDLSTPTLSDQTGTPNSAPAASSSPARTSRDSNVQSAPVAAVPGLGVATTLSEVPVWQKDEDVSHCPLCNAEFTFFNRRHHCRKCGRVVCGACSTTRTTYLPSTYVVSPPSQIFLESPHVPHKTCDECAEELAMIKRALSGAGGSSAPAETLERSSSSHRRRKHKRSAESNPVNDNDFCPICGARIDMLTESEQEAHVNDCLAKAEYSGSPAQRRSNRMIVYKISEPIHKPERHVTHSATPATPAPLQPRISTQEDEDSLRTALGSPISSPVPEKGIVNSFSSADQVVRNAADNDGDFPSPSQIAESAVAQAATSEATPAEEPSAGISDSDETSDIENECVICFEPFLPGDEVARLECLCVYHLKCIKAWFAKRGDGACPVHAVHV